MIDSAKFPGVTFKGAVEAFQARRAGVSPYSSGLFCHRRGRVIRAIYGAQFRWRISCLWNDVGRFFSSLLLPVPGFLERMISELSRRISGLAFRASSHDAC